MSRHGFFIYNQLDPFYFGKGVAIIYSTYKAGEQNEKYLVHDFSCPKATAEYPMVLPGAVCNGNSAQRNTIMDGSCNYQCG